METKNSINVNSSASDIGLAAISGGGTGTLLIYLAQNLPVNHPYKNIFIILAPSASVTITSFWVWATAEFNKRRRDKLVKKTIAELQELCHKKIADPSVPQKQKKIYQKRLEELDETSFQQSLKIIEE